MSRLVNESKFNWNTPFLKEEMTLEPRPHSLPEMIQEAAAQQLEDVEQPPHKDEEKVRKQVTFKFTDETNKKCDPADAKRCASWAGESCTRRYPTGDPQKN